MCDIDKMFDITCIDCLFLFLESSSQLSSEMGGGDHSPFLVHPPNEIISSFQSDNQIFMFESLMPLDVLNGSSLQLLGFLL